MDGPGSAEEPSVCGAPCGEFDWERVVLLAGGKEWYVMVTFFASPTDCSYVYVPSHWRQPFVFWWPGQRRKEKGRANAKAELSLTVPIVNSLAFLFTVVGEWWADGKVIGRDTWIGMAFVLGGITLCVHSKRG